MSQLGGAIQAVTVPLVSLSNFFKKKEQRGGAEEATKSSFNTDSIISWITSLVFMGLAGYLCWSCNVSSDFPLRIIYTVLSIVFSWIYLIYYLLYHYIMGNAC
jgi:hypothetical protein|uniref:Uncharacterized protein n=1 Tax=viral metagenome TaxID=1070528 RepID=A0A6C0BKS6_9ZZZZ